MPDDSQPPQQLIYESWKLSPAAPVFVVDETKTGVARSDHRQLFVYSCVVMTAGNAADVLDNVADARSRLNPEDRERRLKTPDLFKGQELVPYYRELGNVVAGYCRAARRIHCLATTVRHLDDCSARVDTTVTGDALSYRPFGGPESAALLNWLKRVATEEQSGATCVDVVIDSSEGLGLKPGGTLVWTNPNNGPGGCVTAVECSSTFRLIAASDDGPFRDLLLVPDLLGNIALKKLQGRAPGYELAKKAVIEDGEAFWSWSYALRSDADD